MRPIGPAVLALAAVAAGFAADTAHASRRPTTAEKRAIRSAFVKRHPKDARIERIRVSTKTKGVAGVRYSRRLTLNGATHRITAPSPAYYKKAAKGKKGWGPLKTVPAKAAKDIAGAAKSDVVLDGDVVEVFKGAAYCSVSSDFYSADLVNRGSGQVLSIQVPRFGGFGTYPAKSVGSLAALYSDLGRTETYETGQPADANAPSGDIWVQREGGGGGVIEAAMAHVIDDSHPDIQPLTVTVSGTWVCRP